MPMLRLRNWLRKRIPFNSSSKLVAGWQWKGWTITIFCDLLGGVVEFSLGVWFNHLNLIIEWIWVGERILTSFRGRHGCGARVRGERRMRKAQIACTGKHAAHASTTRRAHHTSRNPDRCVHGGVDDQHCRGSHVSLRKVALIINHGYGGGGAEGRHDYPKTTGKR